MSHKPHRMHKEEEPCHTTTPELLPHKNSHVTSQALYITSWVVATLHRLHHWVAFKLISWPFHLSPIPPPNFHNPQPTLRLHICESSMWHLFTNETQDVIRPEIWLVLHIHPPTYLITENQRFRQTIFSYMVWQEGSGRRIHIHCMRVRNLISEISFILGEHRRGGEGGFFVSYILIPRSSTNWVEPAWERGFLANEQATPHNRSWKGRQHEV